MGATENPEGSALLKQDVAINFQGKTEKRGHQATEQVFQKLTRKIVPVCFMVAFLSHVDRTNLGLAAREFCVDLNLDSSAYGYGVGIFFVFYSLFQIPSSIASEKFGAPTWIGMLLIFWGVVASCMAFVRTKSQFFVLRAFLGMAEAGSFPGMWVYLSMFFPEKYRTLPISLMGLGLTLAQILGSPLGAALLSLDNLLGWKGWQWLFFLEGLPSVLLGLWIAFCLPPDLNSASYLSNHEKGLVVKEFESEKKSKVGEISLLEGFRLVSRNKNLWLLTLVKFLRNMTTDVALFWTPLWIYGMLNGGGLSISGNDSPGHSNSSPHQDSLVAALTSIPFTCTAIISVLLAWHSSRKQERRLHIGIPYIISAAIFTFLPLASEMGVILGFLTLTIMLCSCHGPSGILVSLGSSYLEPEVRAIGLAMLNSLGHLGGYVGSSLVGVMVERYGSYAEAILLLSGLLGSGGVIVLLLPDD